MSDQPEEDVDPADAIALAEEYLNGHRQELSADREQAYEEQIEKWERRKAEVGEDDPLYQVATERIQEYERKLEQLQTETEELKRELLEIVSDGFLATGDWMDATLFRALNLILFDKYRDTLVVQRHVLEEDTEFGNDDLYEISKAVRELANSELTEP